MIEKLTRRKVHKLIVRTALGTVSYPHHPRSHVIEDLQTDSKQHLHDSQSDGHLHLVRVGEDQLVLGHVPDRVHSKWVRGHALHSLTGDPGEMTPRRKLDTRRVWTAPEYVTGRLTAKINSVNHRMQNAVNLIQLPERLSIKKNH